MKSLNGNECQSSGEIFIVDFAPGEFFLSVNDNSENHPDAV